LRRELILQKLKGSLISGPESAAIHRTLNALGASCVLPQTNVMPSQALKPPQLFLSGLSQDSISNWAIHEDWAVLQVMQYFQDLPLNLLVLSPGHIPNWDLVSDVVNSISCNYRSAKLCKYHYEMSIIPREEGKVVTDANPKQKQKKVKGVTASPVTPAVTPAASSVSNVINKPIATTRPIRTSQLIVQDNNSSFSQICNQRFETIKQIANKRTPTLKPMFINPTGKNPKHIALLSESGINYEQPLTPIQVAINRAERILREKQKAEQQLAVRQQQLQIKQQQQQTPQIKAILAPNTNIPAAQHQLQQAISAKVAALNQATLSKVSTAAGIISNASATTSTQLNLTKALSQVSVASLTNQQQPQHSLPQPLLSQLNVNQQTIGSPNTSTSEAMSQGLQVSPQTCSVVSVATLTPQAHQKLMAAVSPAVTQIGSQTINRLTTNPHLYKQLILRQQQQQQLQQRQQQSQHIQIQSVPQTAKQIATIGVGQQQQKFQITATVSQQPVQQTQSLIASAGLKGSQPNIVTSIPVAVPMAVTQQQRISTTTATPVKQQQIISTRTVSADPLQIAQLLKQRQIVAQQPSGNLPQTQILLQQSATQSSQPQQILQNPVTFVKTLSSPTTLVTQSLTIPITMTGMNIFTSPATKVVSPTTAITSTTTALTSVPATQLRQIQLLQQKRAQQSPQLLQQQQQQQQIQTHLTQQLGETSD
jgi:E1A-binding protein p400